MGADVEGPGSAGRGARADWKSFAAKVVVVFVVVVGGTITGFYASSKLGLAGRARSESLSPGDLINKTDINIGDGFPNMLVTGEDNVIRPLDSLLKGRASLVGFVSDGCEPCEIFTTSLEDSGHLDGDRYQVILLSVAPGYPISDSRVQVFTAPADGLESIGVYTFPTIVGVSRDGRIRFVSSGYTPALLGEFLERHL